MASIKIKTCLFVTCALASVHVAAADWSANIGLRFSESRSKVSSNPSDGNSTFLNTSLTRRLDAKTQMGGSISYGVSQTDADLNRGRFSSDAVSVALFGVRDIGSLRFVDFSLGYGKVMMDGDYVNGAAPIDFDTDTNFWTAGVGMTQVLVVSPTVSATLNARLNHSGSRTGSYRDSVPASHRANRTARTQASVGATLNWRLGSWSPSAGMTYFRSDRDLTSGVDDKDYFTANLGLTYAISQKTRLNIGYAGVMGKSRSREDSILSSVSTSF